MPLDKVRVQDGPDVRLNLGTSDFRINEVIYSRTDSRGVILSCNTVFQRVSGYGWEELVGAPHKILRHEDIPKGVFHLLWSRINKGEPLGAYVKNRTREGGYYWVYAMVQPCDGGYLSARIKPVADHLDTVKQLYSEQLAKEAEGLTPADSARWLEEQIQEKGFDNYARFMSHALADELVVRCEMLDRPPQKGIFRLRSMLEGADRLHGRTDQLIDDFAMTQTIPFNFRVIASHLETNGGPVSTLSTNYGAMSREMSEWFETNVVGENSNFASIRGTINDSLFLEAMATILHEGADQLDWERHKVSQVDLSHDQSILATLIRQYGKRSEAGQNRVAAEAQRILDACRTMDRHMLGLSTTRVMCKIEAALLKEGRDRLTGIIEELHGFQERIQTQITRIEDHSMTILSLLK